MAVNELPLKTWRKFLRAHGLVKQYGSKHEKWNHPTKPLLRPIHFSRSKKGMISMFIIANNLKNMGLTMEDLEKWLGRK